MEQKWNKNRNKIKVESEHNKQKENSKGEKTARQRTKLIGNKEKNMNLWLLKAVVKLKPEICFQALISQLLKLCV